MTNEEYLRFLLDDRIPEGGTDVDTFFTNADIVDLLARNPNIYAAASDGWSMRAGSYSELLDVEESGSKRALSTLYRHAANRAEFFAKLSKEAGGNVLVNDPSKGNRVTGKPVTLREGSPLSPAPTTSWHHTRRVS